MPEHQSANFNRPPRIQLPELPPEEIEIPPPPELPDLPNQNLLVSIIPVLGIGVMAIAFVFRGLSNSDGSSLTFAVPMVFLAIFTIGGTLLAQRVRRRDYQKRREESEHNYLRLLEKKQVRLQAAHDAQRAILETNFPRPDQELDLALARNERLWERRHQDPDFAALRLGTGRVPSRIRIHAPDPDVDSPGLEHALRLADQYRYLQDAPVIASLLDTHSIGVAGKRALMLKAVRAVICNLASTHAPHDFHIHLIAPHAQHEDWAWLEWLPHASQSHRGGAADLLAFDTDNIRNLLGNLSQVIDKRRERQDHSRGPHLFLVIDGPQLADSEAVYNTILREGNRLGASALCLVNSYQNIPSDCNAFLEVYDEGSFRFAQTGPHGHEIAGNAIDQLSLQDAEHIARALSSVVIRETGGGGRIPQRVDFLDLYALRNVAELLAILPERWARPIPDGVLPRPVPIGRESLAASTELFLDEDHHGPHGVLAGTTGSGKSELLQTLICALAIEHDPRLATFMLIDFKGGSTFNIFAGLPHTVGTISNLDGVWIERALEALKAETQSRQQFLKKMNVRDITQYHRFFARTEDHLQDADYQPLPHLFIIVDEFAQLAKEMPDFMRELVRTVQVGRSLGLHLILGTQSPMDVITDEMNANLQFRICLRVQNIEASRAMLRRPDAAYLPAGWPGRGYFQVGERGLFKQFQTAYAGDDYDLPVDEQDAPEEKVTLELITDTGYNIDLLAETQRRFQHNDERLSDEPYTTARAVCDTLIDYAQAARIPWMQPLLLPPLQERFSLATVFERAIIGGWNGSMWLPPGRDHDGNFIKVGSAPIGLIDDIYNRTQHPLWINLNTGDHDGRDGHLLIIGGPGSGKTTLLRTLALSLALLHAPDKIHMYFLSFTGAGLDDLGNLPHAESAVHGTETGRVRRLFDRLINTLDDRQAGRSEAPQPTIMVCIDQLEQFRDTFYEQHMRDFERLINEGRAVGIYLAVTASSITVIPERIRSLVPQRIALQLGNPADYLLTVGSLNTRIERVLSAGRGFIHNNPPLATQVSLPCFDSDLADDEVRHAMLGIVHDLRSGFAAIQGIDEGTALAEQLQTPPPLRDLPTRIPFDALPITQPASQQALVTALGRRDDDALTIFNLDWAASGPHFVVAGPPGAGKTNLLYAAILAAAQQRPPDALRLLLVDFNGRSLLPLADLKHVISHITDVVELDTQLRHLNSELAAHYANWRENAADPRETPRTIIAIDDYDLTADTLGGHSALLRQLRDHIRLHSELGLHVWVAGYMERAPDLLVKQLLLKRSGFALASKDSLQRLNLRSGDLNADPLPEGRAFFAEQNHIHVIQTALVLNPALNVNRINDQIWPEHRPAAWQHPADLAQPPENAPVQQPSGAETGGDALDIDTAGLIQDLLDEQSGD